MNPRPLHRSIIFWAGIFVGTFIVWASYHFEDRYAGFRFGQVSCYSGPSGFYLYRSTVVHGAPYGGTVNVPLMDPLRRDTFAAPSFRRAGAGAAPPLAHAGQVRSYLERQQSAMFFMPAGSWMLFTPYWLLLFALALPWSLLLLWRSRRVRTAEPVNPHAQAPPALQAYLEKEFARGIVLTKGPDGKFREAGSVEQNLDIIARGPQGNEEHDG